MARAIWTGAITFGLVSIPVGSDKRRGREAVAQAGPPEPTEMPDLLEALQRSVDAARDGRGSGSDGAGSAGDGAAPDPASATEAQLQRMVRDLDVRGRSSMNRDEPADAVRRAS